MDASGTGEITLETFLDNFDVTQYPDVKTGQKTPWKALRDIEDFFQCCSVSHVPTDHSCVCERMTWWTSGQRERHERRDYAVQF